MGPNGVIVLGGTHGITFSTADVKEWQRVACEVFASSFTPAEWAAVIGGTRPYAKTCL